jgi:hypothetical protein
MTLHLAETVRALRLDQKKRALEKLDYQQPKATQAQPEFPSSRVF